MLMKMMRVDVLRAGSQMHLWKTVHSEEGTFSSCADFTIYSMDFDDMLEHT